MTQAEMTQSALNQLEAAEQELNMLVQSIETRVRNRSAFHETQRLWNLFAEHQCKERAGLFNDTPGTMASAVYAAEKRGLILQRIAELKAYEERVGSHL